MSVCRIALWLVPLIPWLSASEAAASPQQLQTQAQAHYERAQRYYGVAIGERQTPSDPACLLLNRSIAGLLCLRGDVAGCLEASAQIGRVRGFYQAPLELPAGAQNWSAASAFLQELHQVSVGFGKDASLASECLGLLEQVAGDAIRQDLVKQLGPAFQKARSQAEKGQGQAALASWLQAGRLAILMMDQKAMIETAGSLAGVLRNMRSNGQAISPWQDDIVLVLGSGRNAMRAVGEDSQADLTEALLQEFSTKALTPPDLAFDLAPDAEKFKSDLSAAVRQLKALSQRAPFHSRAQMILSVVASYADLIQGRAQAVDPLNDLVGAIAGSDPYLAARVRGMAGRALLLSGDYEGAVRELSRAAEDLGEEPAVQTIRGLLLGNQAQSLFYLGRYSDAALVFERTSQSLAPADPAKVSAYLGWAHACFFDGRLEEANAALAKAEQQLKVLSVPDTRRRSLTRSLQLERALGQVFSKRPEDAIQLFAQVAREAQADSDLKPIVVARTNLAELYNDQGAPEKALVEADAALKMLSPKAQADAAWQALTEKGRALATLGHKQASVLVLQQAVDLVERLRAGIGAEGSRRSFAAAKTRLYRQMVQQLQSLGRQAEAFEVSERARGRAFLDMLGERRLLLGKPADQSQLATWRGRMLNALPPLVLGFEEPAGALFPGASSGRPPPVDAPSDPKQNWLFLVTTNPARVAQVQSVLKPKEALLAYFHDGRSLQIFVVKHKSLSVVSVDVSEQELGNYVESFERLLQQPQRGEELIQKKGQRLLQWLLPEGQIDAGILRLVVVPWGPLHSLPWMALWDGQRYLVDRFEWVAVPSASVMVMNRSRLQAQSEGLLALGNPTTDLPDLPAAAKEVESLIRWFGKSSVYVGAQAQKSLFAEKGPASRWIHVAAHGVFVPQQPMDSYLALAGPPPEQGHLTALQILGLDLSRVQLVVLSACETGRAKIEKGEEVIGFSRAFLHAGAGALMASFWSVGDDSTQALMEKFYQAIQQGLSSPQALAQAARGVKQLAGYSHPFYWAGFGIVGGN